MDRKRMLAWMLILLFLGVPMLALITSDTDGDLGEQGGGSTWANLSTAGFQEGSIFTNSTIATGYQHACAVVENGSIFCWGDNSYGQLGIGSRIGQDYPVMTSLPEGSSAISVSTSDEATCSILTNGSLYCWGGNGHGQVADVGLSSELGTVEEPVHVPLPGGRTAVSVSTGQQYACAILDNASLYCWGNAEYGRLGTASQSNDLGGQSWTDDPTYVDLGGVGVIAVSAGGQGTTCAILQNQSLYCWGDNSHGQVGDGTYTSTHTPTLVEISGNTIAVSVGSKHTCALSDETPSSYTTSHTNTLYCWGDGESGKLGQGNEHDSTTPLEVTFSGEVTPRSVSSGSDSTCMISSAEETYCWGDNDEYEIGRDGSTWASAPEEVQTPDGSVGVAVGGEFACVLSDSGGNSASVYCWGLGDDGQLGRDGNGLVSSTATLAGILGSERDYDSDGVIAIMDSHHPGGQSGSTVISTKVASGGAHSCAIDASGDVSCWGFNAYGELGNGVTVNPAGGVTPTGHPVTADLPGGSVARSIAAGGAVTCAVLENDSLYCWGQNNVNQLGTGGDATTGESTPQHVALSTSNPDYGVRAVATGGSHTCAISTGDNVWCWGSDTNGELGKGGSGSDDSLPDHASFGGDNHGHGAAIGIALGSQHSCAAFEDGSVYCWGDNTYGQLGLGDWDNRSSPTQVDLGDGNSAASIAAGDWHTCALLDDGSATCWGRNDDGQLGDLSTTNRSTPATVAYFTGFASISAGARHTCASQSDMDLYCWGDNDDNQLGHSGNSPVTQATIVDLTFYNGYTNDNNVMVAAGTDHTCGVLDDGDVQCWGSGTLGQVGNGQYGSPRPRINDATASTGDSDEDGDGRHDLFEDYPENPARSEECPPGYYGRYDCSPAAVSEFALGGGVQPDQCPAGTSTEAIGSTSSADCLTDTDGDLMPDTIDGDDDEDGVPDASDLCPGTANGTNVASDGCSDLDHDGISDSNDSCAGLPTDGWASSSETDHDSDGCADDGIDSDDDNDGVADGSDDCPTGDLGWTATASTDYDGDGCQDSGEDGDDDNDGVGDADDDCQTGFTGWSSSATTDHDSDGCWDGSSEDGDDDNDGIGDSYDSCPFGNVGWSSNSSNDHDSDGCKDDTSQVTSHGIDSGSPSLVEMASLTDGGVGFTGSLSEDSLTLGDHTVNQLDDNCDDLYAAKMSSSGDWEWLVSFPIPDENAVNACIDPGLIAPSENGGMYLIGQMHDTMEIDGYSIDCNGHCVYVIKIHPNGSVDWWGRVQGTTSAFFSLSSISSDPGNGITVDILRGSFYASSDHIVTIETSVDGPDTFITASGGTAQQTHHYVSFSETGHYMGHYTHQSTTQVVRMGDDLYLREHTSLPEGDYAYLRAVPQDCGYGCVYNFSRIDYDSTFTASLTKIDGGVYVWLELTGEASEPPDLDYACVWASPLQWCDGPEIPGDHYLLNMTAGGGFADGIDTLGYDLLSDHPYREDEALFIENGTRLHSLSGLPLDFELLGMVDRDDFPSFHRISSHGLVSFDSVSEEFLTFLPEEDYDDDDDSVPDASDACQSGDLGWTSASANDHDSDGCRDESEDDDDDNDGVADLSDLCQTGLTNWAPNATTDYDSDGCRDESEDDDDDNDGVADGDELCPKGDLGWTSSLSTDHDSDGCRDESEDDDDDNDGVEDISDGCPLGFVGWDSSSEDSDHDGDGCKDDLTVIASHQLTTNSTHGIQSETLTDGSVAIAGSFSSENLSLGTNETSGEDAVFLAKMGPDGQWDFLISFEAGDDGQSGDAGSTELVGIAAAPEGGVFVALEFTGEINVDGWSISARDQDVLLARVSSNGSIEWVRYFGSTINENAYDLSVDSSLNPSVLYSRWGQGGCSLADPCTYQQIYHFGLDSDGNEWSTQDTIAEGYGYIGVASYSTDGSYGDTWKVKQAGAGSELCDSGNAYSWCWNPMQLETVDGVQTVLSTFNGNYPGLEGLGGQDLIMRSEGSSFVDWSIIRSPNSLEGELVTIEDDWFLVVRGAEGSYAQYEEYISPGGTTNLLQNLTGDRLVGISYATGPTTSVFTSQNVHLDGIEILGGSTDGGLILLEGSEIFSLSEVGSGMEGLLNYTGATDWISLSPLSGNYTVISESDVGTGTDGNGDGLEDTQDGFLVEWIGLNEDTDFDDDSVTNLLDDCTEGETEWLSNSTTDHDSDGCRDAGEDDDDDNDSMEDLSDSCPKGELGWTTGPATDYDSDGCRDAGEDEDDDDDAVPDADDLCQTGQLGWTSLPTTDHDSDGCRDADEDDDDDGDGAMDGVDSCATGALDWDTNSTTDYDADGCSDSNYVVQEISLYIGSDIQPKSVSLPDGSVVFYGVFNRPSMTLGEHTVNLSEGGCSGFIAKLARNGTWAWLQSFDHDPQNYGTWDGCFENDDSGFLAPRLATPSGNGGVYLTYSYDSVQLSVGDDTFNAIGQSMDVLLIHIEEDGSIGFHAVMGGNGDDEIISISTNAQNGNNSVTLLFERGYSCGTYFYIDGSAMENSESVYTCGHHNTGSSEKRYLLSFSPEGELEDGFLITTASGGYDSVYDYGLEFEDVEVTGGHAYILSHEGGSVCMPGGTSLHVRVKPIDHGWDHSSWNPEVSRPSENRSSVCLWGTGTSYDDYKLVQHNGSIFLWFDGDFGEVRVFWDLGAGKNDEDNWQTADYLQLLSDDLGGGYLLNVTVDGGYAGSRTTHDYHLTHSFGDELVLVGNNSELWSIRYLDQGFVRLGDLDIGDGCTTTSGLSWACDFERLSQGLYVGRGEYIDGVENWTLDVFTLEEDWDDDNDGHFDSNDAFPLDSSEWLDTDEDGIGGNEDLDDDGDGVGDYQDAFPLDSSEWLDTDEDGTGDNADADDDGDGVADGLDSCPTGMPGWTSNSTTDYDSDGCSNEGEGWGYVSHEIDVGNNHRVFKKIASDEEGGLFVIGNLPTNQNDQLLGVFNLSAYDSTEQTQYVAYRNAIGIFEWVTVVNYSGSGVTDVWLTEISNDPEGGAMVGGTCSSTSTDGKAYLGEFEVPCRDNFFFLAKISDDGQWTWVQSNTFTNQWTDTFNPISSYDNGRMDIEPGPDGSFFLAARWPYGDGGNFDAYIGGQQLDEETRMFVSKIDSDGNWEWTRQPRSPFHDLEVDGQGNSYLLFIHDTTVDCDYYLGSGPSVLNSYGEDRTVVCMLTPEGNSGWHVDFGDGSEVLGQSMAIGDGGEVLISGRFRGSFYGVSSVNYYSYYSSPKYDLFLISLDSENGDVNWVLSKGTGNNTDVSQTEIVVGEDGRIYVSRDTYLFGPGINYGANLTSVEIAIPNGTWLETFENPGAGSLSIHMMALGHENEVSVLAEVSSFQGTFGGNEISASGDHRQIWITLTTVEDSDDDEDSMADYYDRCVSGDLGWTANSTTDHDSDGCQDSGEDLDDDNDGVGDSPDSCSRGDLGWTANSTTDHDSDGCQDSGEDLDDDNDGMEDVLDSCSKGDLSWTSDLSTDYDSDGCQDSGEDLDDDDDGVPDGSDLCARGYGLWSSNSANDHDSDGCLDEQQDVQSFDIYADSMYSQRLSDGGVAFVGKFSSNFSVGDLDVNTTSENNSFYVVKMDHRGEWLWEFTFHQEKGYEQYGTANSTWSFSIEEVEMSEDGGTYVLIEFIGLVTLNGNDFETSRCCGSSSSGYYHRSNLALIKVGGDGNMSWAGVFGHRGDDKSEGIVLRESGDIEIYYDPIYPPGCASYSQSACDGYQMQSFTHTDGSSTGIGYGNEGFKDSNPKVISLSPEGSVNLFRSSGFSDSDSFNFKSVVDYQGDNYFISETRTLSGGETNGFKIFQVRCENYGTNFGHDPDRAIVFTSPGSFEDVHFIEIGGRLLVHYNIGTDSYALIDNESDFERDISEWDVNLSGPQLVDVTGCDTWDPDNLVNRSMSGDLLPLLTGVHGEAYFGHFISGNDTHVYSLQDINGSLTPVGELSTLNGFLTSPPWASILGPSGFIHYDSSDTSWAGYTIWVTNFEEDPDDDNDGITDNFDLCSRGATGWNSSVSTDYDTDGCQDSTEDTDDDGDGVIDTMDWCYLGETGWTSNSTTDNDQDGCQDSSEDDDDDWDGIPDSLDACPSGDVGWTPNSTTDFDSDGCQDSGEDEDDDNDGVSDTLDLCPTGDLGWASNGTTDHDSDGCQDSGEDEDDDNDGVSDTLDLCPTGDLGWASNGTTDHDSDGCYDSSEDADDDNDSLEDGLDSCATGDLDWTSNSTTDHDSDGCQDSSEDADDDNDDVSDTLDLCPTGDLGWASNSTTDYDYDGCQDSSEDADDDNDDVSDSLDLCPTGDLGWASNGTTDHDSDGCQDSGEDEDDDNDSIDDDLDLCQAGQTGWTSNSTNDVDSDGCLDWTEDFDWDNDGVDYDQDSCSAGEMNWTSSPTSDHDSDGCQDSSEDTDDDNDSIDDDLDSCSTGDLGWVSNSTTDYDSDGCQDSGEDTDDDDDSIDDDLDSCSTGDLGWTSDNSTDYDSDGCQDSGEDTDDDNDSVPDTDDLCPTGDVGWAPDSSNDYDSDGCQDSGEDLDDDNDSLEDGLDSCPTGDLGWTSDNSTDYDSDGCQDSGEDTDDDDDSVPDTDDLCQTGEMGWNSTSNNDWDSDGCLDSTEDDDDDNDSLEDGLDSCATGDLDWTSNSTSDYDSDGCQDSSEDDDDDNDGVGDVLDLCSTGGLGWTSNSTTDWDSDGCLDVTEDSDDDNDGISDGLDSCSTGDLGWDSNSTSDHDSDGCQDSGEDQDDDNDGVLDGSDLCATGALGWTSNSTSDYDSDGCQDSGEDSDDDNDSVSDTDDLCQTGEMGWNSTSNNDWDSDGCQDSGEDTDDDNDSIDDDLDSCSTGDLGWTSDNSTDYDSDGCQDSGEDQDDDNDGVLDGSDLCGTGTLGWTSNSTSDYDSDGCLDSEEDLDDDNDGVSDVTDDCSVGDLGWNSTTATDHDSDGCQDSGEDSDDDNDSVADINDACQAGDLGWEAGNSTDWDSDGCQDSGEDLDDDNDGFHDDVDACNFLPGTSTKDRRGCLDSDGDGWSDPDQNWDWASGADNYTLDPSQWSDSDGDGYGDNLNGTDPDSCPQQFGTSTSDRLGCIDDDGDGLSNDFDDFPMDADRNFDNDSDGYDDDLDDFCPGLTGFSSQDRMGCPDSDDDGYSNPDLTWSVSDGADAFVSDDTQWADFDGDGYGDNQEGAQPDSCPTVFGTSQNDRFGCPDGDGDGWSDPDLGWTVISGADAFPSEPSQWSDTDGDGFGDEQGGYSPDDCPESFGLSSIDRRGCLDSDGDGRSDPDQYWTTGDGADAVPDEPTQYLDSDGDGYGDDPSGQNYDSCPGEVGDSNVDRYGCEDDDGDGVSNLNDRFDNDPSRWYDSDEDGVDDLLDDCPYTYGESYMDRSGCPDSDKDGYSNPDQEWPIEEGADRFPNEITQWSDQDGDGVGDNPGGEDPDMCLDTLFGEETDNQGCSAVQRDTDGDGMNDAEDPCVSSSRNICKPNASGLAALVWLIGALLSAGIISIAVMYYRKREAGPLESEDDMVVQARRLAREQDRKLEDVLADLEDDGVANWSAGSDAMHKGEDMIDGRRFVKVRKLRAEGGMAEVYQGKDKQTGEQVIWKQAAPSRNLSAKDANSALANEVEVLERLDHPRIPEFVESGFVVNEEGDRVLVLIMERIDGGSLDDEMKTYVRKGIKQELGYVIETLVQCCEALEYMADLDPPLYHRDIKPHNIMAHPERGVVLIDFGLAKEVTAGKGLSLSMGAHTLGWSPPERERAQTGSFTDVYSLGQVLWYMLTNEPAGIYSEAKRIEAITEAGHPEWLASLVNQATIPDDPERRIQTVTEFRIRLENEGEME